MQNSFVVTAERYIHSFMTITGPAEAVRSVQFWPDHFFTQAKKKQQKVPCRLQSVQLYGMAEKVIKVQ